MTDGPVLELGTGLFSTPLLHWLCKEKQRKLVSCESVTDFFEFPKSFRSKNHTVHFIDDWDKLDNKEHWSVIFIDHTVERRAIDAIRFKDSADYIVIHDTESNEYGYDKVWQYFKYRYDWKECRPWTTVVSNIFDVTKL